MYEMEGADDIELPQTDDQKSEARDETESESEPDARNSFYEELWERQHPEEA